MKNALITTTALFATLFSLSAYADDTMSSPTAPVATPASATTPAVTGGAAMTGPSMTSGGHGMGGNGNHPCKKIAEACQSAGYTKGGESTGKGLMMNCLKPLISGQAVAGVNVSSTDVAACQAKRAEHQRPM